MTKVAAATLVILVVASLTMLPGGAEGGASRPCGTVSLGHRDLVKVAITKGPVSCARARSIAKDYNHPKAWKAYCHPVDHLCEYGVYPEGWRCTGLFQGGFGCWLGGDVRGKNARASFSATAVEIGSSKPSTGRSARERGRTMRRARGAGPIYFWGNVGDPISTPVHGFHNPPVVRPKTIVIFVDGQWVLEKLHWEGWGSPVVKATGKSSSSDDDPNAEEGKRIITWAKVTLYDPGVFHGRRVYRCITIKVPPPAHWGTGCLQRSGNSVLLLPPGSGTPVGGEPPAGAPRHLESFLSPDRKVWCTLYGGSLGAACGTYPRPPTWAAFLDEAGKVDLCEVLKVEYAEGSKIPEGCFQNWPAPHDGTPVLAYGQSSQNGGFRCTSAKGGISCLKASGRGKGHGFRVYGQGAVELSPATEASAEVRAIRTGIVPHRVTRAWPEHFGLASLSSTARTQSRKECLHDQGGCVSYGARCRRVREGRIECYQGIVRPYPIKTKKASYEESFRLFLWYPPHGPGRLKASVKFVVGALLQGPRCPVRPKPFLCNGPWIFTREPTWPWEGPFDHF